MKYLIRKMLIIFVLAASVMFSVSHAATKAAPSNSQIIIATPAEAAAAPPSPYIDSAALVAKVVWVKGTVAAIRPGSPIKRVLKQADDVYMNDTLITDSHSEGQIVFTDDSNLSLRAETNLYINEYNYSRLTAKKQSEKKSAGRYFLDLVTGGFRTITGLVAKENSENYQIDTPVATIGVRGTEFSIVYKQDKGLYVKRYKGTPCVKGKVGGKSGKEVCLDGKNKYAYVKDANSDPEVLVKQPEVFRNDVEIIFVTYDSIINGVGGFCVR